MLSQCSIPLHNPPLAPVTRGITFRTSDLAARSCLYSSRTAPGGSLSSLDRTLRVEMSRFQTIDADAVVMMAVIEDERLLAVRQTLVGSLVRRCEGWAVVIAEHKVVGAVCQSGRHERWSGAVRGGRSRCQVANCLAESLLVTWCRKLFRFESVTVFNSTWKLCN